MQIKVDEIRKLREKTGGGIADCRKALVEAKGDFKRAEELLKGWGIVKAASKADREVGAGLVETYVHSGGRVGSMVEVNCETDFVARTDEFKNLAHEVAMQVAAMDPADVEELLKQDYIREVGKTIDQLIKETIAKVGENIMVKRFVRYELG
ncbi:translation elongation factor Ts [Candidatus Curtissbacteria bacterium RIFCSPLOWO2_01_FULL_42_26]|uniref:Elongation factor Ts n=1 Tax=Candidatus Curtissbacteria bacterium RIFCSPLOWO2_01_FULL_42_26 TaxID=1797729 RepID=A0A1F5I1U1_9BACT|nr:MAG: translation elongation factor Ts [Candidatus Curtissbacteria bacterium RIFCSPLOWO2_01_FULL_42_26]